MSPRAAWLRLPGAWWDAKSSRHTLQRWREPEIDTPERRGGGDRKISAASSAFLRVAILALGALLAGLQGSSAWAQSVTAPGTAIRNSALLSFDRAAGVTDSVRSNEVVTLVAPARSRAAIQFSRTVGSGAGSPTTSGPTSCQTASGYQVLANPVLIGGQALDPTQAVPMAATPMFHGGEPLFIHVTDHDRNRDAQVLDVVDVTVRSVATGDTETLRLTETGPNTGEFVGYVPSATGAAAPGDCTLQVALQSNVTVDYVDPLDATDAAARYRGARSCRPRLQLAVGRRNQRRTRQACRRDYRAAGDSVRR